MRWFDKAGFNHHAPLITTERDPEGYETSENGLLFSAVLHSLTRQWVFPAYQLCYKSKRQFQATPISGFKTSHFSYDNMLGMYYFSADIKRLPIVWWWSKGKPYIRQEMIFFFVLQYPRLGKIFYPYLKSAMRRSLAKPADDTNGKNKWWLRCQMLPPEFLEEATDIIERIYSNSWAGVFEVYYKHQADHPIIRAARERWSEAHP